MSRYLANLKIIHNVSGFTWKRQVARVFGGEDPIRYRRHLDIWKISCLNTQFALFIITFIVIATLKQRHKKKKQSIRGIKPLKKNAFVTS